MPIEIVLPRLGWNMESGQVGEWLKKDGEHVEAGEILLTVEGDKATQEVESLDSGVLHIPVDSPPPGIEVPVGTLLAYLLEPGETLPFSAPPAPVVERAGEDLNPTAEAVSADQETSPDATRNTQYACHQPPRSARCQRVGRRLDRTHGQWSHRADSGA